MAVKQRKDDGEVQTCLTHSFTIFLIRLLYTVKLFPAVFSPFDEKKKKSNCSSTLDSVQAFPLFRFIL